MGRRAHIAESDPAALANLIETEFEILLGNLDNGPNPRLFYGFETPPSTVAAMVVNEAVMHGRDLAQVTGAKPPMLTNAEAHAAAEATMISTHIFVDPDKVAAQPDGLYHVKFRGGKDFTWTKSGRELVVSEGKPERADAHLNTDAGMFMLSSMGRVSQMRAAFSGKMVTYGKKPWRFLGLGNTVAEGV